MGYSEFNEIITTEAENYKEFDKLIEERYRNYPYIDFMYEYVKDEDAYDGLYKAFRSNLSRSSCPDREDYSYDSEGEYEYQEDVEKYRAAVRANPYIERYCRSSLYIYNMGNPYIKCSITRKEITEGNYFPFSLDRLKSLFKVNKGKKYMIIKSCDRDFEHVVMGDGKLKECTDYCKEHILDGLGSRYYVINRSLTKYWVIKGSETSKSKYLYHIFGNYHF